MRTIKNLLIALLLFVGAYAGLGFDIPVVETS
jgi:hypothetical protein